jgi:FkbM family methyltransferase
MTSSQKKRLKSFILKHPLLAEKFYRLLALFRAKQAIYCDTSFGQSREDSWFLHTLREKQIPWAESGFYVDLGANHPVVFSATYLFYKAGWRGLTVDPIPSLCDLHRRLRPRDICLNTGVGAASERRSFWETVPDVFSSFSAEDASKAQAAGLCTILRETTVAVDTPAGILAKAPENMRVNYLSIDTEGLDAEILRHWPWEISRPDIISCEASGTGSGPAEADSILRGQGYVPIKRFPICGFWGTPAMAAELT